jgi:hypothetical protein
MTECRWAAPAHVQHRLCFEHDCYGGEGDERCPIGRVLRLADLLEQDGDTWQRAMASSIRLAVKGLPE